MSILKLNIELLESGKAERETNGNSRFKTSSFRDCDTNSRTVRFDTLATRSEGSQGPAVGKFLLVFACERMLLTNPPGKTRICP